MIAQQISLGVLFLVPAIPILRHPLSCREETISGKWSIVH